MRVRIFTILLVAILFFGTLFFLGGNARAEHLDTGYWFNTRELITINNESNDLGWELFDSGDLVTPIFGDGIRWNGDIIKGDEKYVIFKQDPWSKTPCDKYTLDCTIDNTTRTAIYIDKNLWLNLKDRYTDNQIITATLDRIYPIGALLWKHKTMEISIDNPMYYKPPGEYGLVWDYEDSSSLENIKINSSCCGILSIVNSSNTETIFESENYQIIVNASVNSLPLPNFVDRILKKTNAGDFATISYGQVPIRDPNDSNATVPSITGVVYIGGVCGAIACKVTAAEDTVPNDITVTLTPDGGNPRSVTLDNHTSAFTFSSVPYNNNYTVSINEKLDSDWEDFTQRFESLKTLVFGGDDYYLSGEIEFKVDSNGDVTAIGGRASNQGPADIILQTSTVTTEEKAASIFEDALNNALQKAFEFLFFGIQKVSDWINQAINESADIDTATLRMVSKNIRNISLSLLTLGLLIVAFANILNLQIEQYGVGRMVPKFIIGIVMAYFSYFIAMFLISLMGALQSLMIGAISSNGIEGAKLGLDSMFTGGENFMAAMLNTGSFIGQSILFIVFMICFLIVFIWLWLIMIVRKAMLMILVAIAPLAFIMMIMPFTEKYYKQWWAQFWKWAFIGPAVIFFILLAKLFLEAWVGQTFGDIQMIGNPNDPASADTWIYMIVFGIFIFMAGYIPLKLGGEIYGAITNKAWNNKHNPIKNRLDLAAKSRDEARNLKLREKQAKLAQTKLGFLSGMNKKQAVAAREALKADIAKNYADKSVPELNQLALSSKGITQEAILDDLASKGLLDMGDARVMTLAAQRAAKDGGFANKITANQREAYAAMASRATGLDATTQKFVDMQAGKTFEGLKPEDYKPEHFEYLVKRAPKRFAQLIKDRAFVETVMTKGNMKGKAALGEGLRYAFDNGDNDILSAHQSIQDNDVFNFLNNAQQQAVDWENAHTKIDETGAEIKQKIFKG